MRVNFPITIIIIICGILLNIFDSKGSEIREGIYFSANEFLNGSPSLKKSDLRQNGKSVNSIKNWFKSDSLFYNESGTSKYLPATTIWGFYENNNLYIQKKNTAHKVSIFGRLCFYQESYPVINAPFSPVVMDQSRNIIPRIFNFDTMETLEYQPDVLEEIFREKDKELYDQFMSLENNRKRRQLMFKYIELYNERHPLQNSGD